MAGEREFEWDDDKDRINRHQHGIAFDLATRVFLDPMVLEYDDPFPHEQRWNAVGYIDGRLIHVTYTLRGDACRIISARRAERHERKRYHEV